MEKRIIISNVQLSKFVNAVIKTELETVDVENNRMCLRSNNDIGVPVESKGAALSFEFDDVQWLKVKHFVDQLPEQPIVVDIENWGGERFKKRLST